MQIFYVPSQDEYSVTLFSWLLGIASKKRSITASFSITVIKHSDFYLDKLLPRADVAGYESKNLS